jgi:NAD(P)-dependent dehydrogenase (short-subunit alcohol dehydrogenase family)
MTPTSQSPTALITGGSKGFGRALAAGLRAAGWTVVIDARDRKALDDAARELGAIGIAGDITDAAHRAALAAAVARLGRLDLLVNNASHLGPSPQPSLDQYPIDELRQVYEVDVLAPVALAALVLSQLVASSGAIVNVSSDAAIAAYPGWGGYGSAKAALDQVSAVLAVEQPRIRVYAFDPGDMRTDMHQRAFPGEDISDRVLPEAVVPELLRLIADQPASGRYRSSEVLAP